MAEERRLPFLLVGGNAVILLGFPRTTIDIDLLVPEGSRSAWLDLMRDMGMRLYHGTSAFAQFEGGASPVDLMFVGQETWEKLSAAPLIKPFEGFDVRLPRPEHLVAMKLHSAGSPHRSKPEVDWEDIRHIVGLCGLSLEDPDFRGLVTRHGGQKAVERVRSWQE